MHRSSTRRIFVTATIAAGLTLLFCVAPPPQSASRNTNLLTSRSVDADLRPDDRRQAHKFQSATSGDPRRSALPTSGSKNHSDGPVFIENRGQFDDRVKFRVVGNGRSLWLTNEGITFDFEHSADQQYPTISRAALKPSKIVPLDPARVRQAANSHPTKLKRIVFTERLSGAEADHRIEPKEPVPGSYNYFIGADPARWRTNVRGYREVIYHDIWQGIDLRLYANGQNLEQEFIVHPGADPTQVRVAYDGIRNVYTAKDGSIKIRTKVGELTETKPRIYQEIAGNRVPLKGRFKVYDRNSYSFEVEGWSGDSDLVIDPTLLYSTFLGGSAGVNCGNPPFGGCGVSDVAYGIAVDAAGSAYVTGVTASPDFPITPGAFQSTNTGECAFVTKLSPLGDHLEYSTYLGPGSNLSSNGIAVNSAGEAYITGVAQTGFPTTSNALHPTFNGGVFITKLSANGDALMYSTQWGRDFGGGAGGEAIAVDSAGKAFVTGFANNGYSTDTTPGAFQTSVPGGRAAFLAVVDPSQSGTASLIYGTCLGGSGVDHGRGIAVDAYGMAYITGDASSANFPTTPGAYQTSFAGGGDDAFVAKFNPNASGSASLLYSTYLGGPREDVGFGIAADPLGNAYAVGFTQSGNNSANFPTTPGAIQTTYPGGDFSGFVTKLSAGGSHLVFSSYHGGVQGYSSSVAVDPFGDAYVAGSGGSGLPVTPDAFQPVFRGGNFFSRTDAFLTKFNPDGGLMYSSYLGGTGADGAYGVAIDSVGDAYLTGYTTSVDFPSTPFAFQPAINTGGSEAPDDVFLTKFPFGPSGALSINRILPNSGGNAGTVSPQIFGSGFHIGTSVELITGTGAQVAGQQVSVEAGGTVITTTFDLRGISPGIWDLIVTNPDGTNTTLSQAFTVVQGGTPDVWVSLIGFPKIRSGRPQAYAIAYGNRGNVDAGQTRFWITFPSFLTWQPATGQTPGSIGRLNDNTVIAFDVPLARAGSRSTIPIILSAPNGSDFAHRQFEIQAWKDTSASLGSQSIMGFHALSRSLSLPNKSSTTLTVSVGDDRHRSATASSSFNETSNSGYSNVAQSPGLSGRYLGFPGASLTSPSGCALQANVAIDLIQTAGTLTAGLAMTVPRDNSCGIQSAEDRTRQYFLEGTLSSNGIRLDPHAGPGPSFQGRVDVNNTLDGTFTFPPNNDFDDEPLQGTLTVKLRIPWALYQSLDNEIRQALPNNILVPHLPCIPGPGQFDEECTELGAFDLLRPSPMASTVQGLEAFARECNCGTIKVTAGSELDHHAVSPMSHSTGYKVDLGLAVSNYITSTYVCIGPRGDKCNGGPIEQYSPLPSGGSIFANECSHWDVTFVNDSTKSLAVSIAGNGGGQVTSDPPGIDCKDPVCSQLFTKGTQVQLTASSTYGTLGMFDGWSGAVNSTDQSITLIVDEDKSVTAHFSMPNPPPGGHPGGGGSSWKWSSTLAAWLWCDPNGCNSPECPGSQPPQGCWRPFDPSLVDPSLAGCKGGWAYDGSCPSPPPPPPCSGCIIGGEVITPSDPNDKTGTTGVGAQHYVSGSTPLSYAIFFSNEETASAAAQDVVITDQLDLAKYDLRTLTFGPIAVADKLVTPFSNGANSFSNVLDLRPSINLFVRIIGQVDPSTGLVTWRLTSVDPLTAQPPEDPSAGFLPPGAEGSVFFTTMPKQGLATNSLIQNQATITFDANTPMSTQTWFNTLDNMFPTSHVLALPANQSGASFPVQWFGADSESGIQSFTAYGSDNGGPFTAFQIDTTATSATFNGQAGHTYAFYSIARDNVGNIEAAKTAGEAVTTVPYSAPTAIGSPVTVQLGNITVIFTTVTAAGTTTAAPIDPTGQGAPPAGNSIIGPADDIATTATYSGPVRVCFNLPSVTDPSVFSHLKILHSENGTLVDRTVGQNFSSHTLCASVDSLSPFVVAQGSTPTAAPATISGRVTTGDGSLLAGVTVRLSGQSSATTITDSGGNYRFDNVETDNFYTVTPSLVNYHFNPANRSFSLLANKTDAVFTATPDAVVAANAIDTTEFFVRQQYLDFLNREPDAAGFDYWTSQIAQCNPSDQTCVRNKRIDVSNAFFFEQEYQQTAAYVLRLYRAAYGNNQPFPNPDNSNLTEAAKLPSYALFGPDRARVIGGADLASGQRALANLFVQRPEFLAIYPTSQDGPTFVSAVLSTIKTDLGADLSSQNAVLLALFNSGGRGAVMYRLADQNATNPINNQAFIDEEYNRAFVFSQYSGYLRRDADIGGFLFWLDQVSRGPLRDTGRQHAMVCSFIKSIEYQQRFSSVVSHNNTECR